MDRSCKLESVVLEGTWLLIALSEYVHPIFSRIYLWCYCIKRTPLNVIMKQLNVMAICVAKFLSVISRLTPKESYFSSIIDASVNLVRCFPLRVKKTKNKKQKKTKPNAESMDRSWKFQGVVSQKLKGTWLFMWLHYLGMFTLCF